MSFDWFNDYKALFDTLYQINATQGKGKLRDMSRDNTASDNCGFAYIDLQFGKMIRSFRISPCGRKVTFCNTTRLIKQSF